VEVPSSTPDKTKKKEISILVLCLLIGFALRFYTFDQKSLWEDEIYTFNESRYGLKDQFKFYKENPAYLHPPLFFLLTHLFYPFTKPERDLRIIPLIFGTLSIVMVYLLAKTFSPKIALPCAISLAFTTYLISLSQEGRSYSLLMFLGMIGLYFFLEYLKTFKKGYLVLVALLFATLFLTSYSSIPFIILSQILWFYQPREANKKIPLSSFLILNGLVLLFCMPWLLFVVVNYGGQQLMESFQAKVPFSFWNTLYGVLHDWVPHFPLRMVAVILLVLFPILSRSRKNAFVLLLAFVAPIGGLNLFCVLFNINHFISSRYFVSFLPLFFITLYLCLDDLENKFAGLKRVVRLKFLFLFLFIASNLVILPLYYGSEKQDFRSLSNYLKRHLRQGDKLLDIEIEYTPGILHYFGVYPGGRQYVVALRKISGGEFEFRTPFVYQNQKYTIYSSKQCCDQYIADGNRLWIIAGIQTAKKIKEDTRCILKGYFDGSFLNFNRFPTDASIYLFLLDPQSPNEKGIVIPTK
jgi:hypothetical protein